MSSLRYLLLTIRKSFVAVAMASLTLFSLGVVGNSQFLFKSAAGAEGLASNDALTVAGNCSYQAESILPSGVSNDPCTNSCVDLCQDGYRECRSCCIRGWLDAV